MIGSGDWNLAKIEYWALSAVRVAAGLKWHNNVAAVNKARS